MTLMVRLNAKKEILMIAIQIVESLSKHNDGLQKRQILYVIVVVMSVPDNVH